MKTTIFDTECNQIFMVPEVIQKETNMEIKGCLEPDVLHFA